MCIRRVPPVHQSPTEKVPRLGRLLRRLTRSPPAEHTDQPRKAPGNAAFSGPGFRVSKTPKGGRVDWLGNQDSNLNDLNGNPLKYPVLFQYGRLETKYDIKF
jgi:hypothetical protein